MSGTLNAITGWLLFTSIALSAGAVIARAVILPRVGKGEDPSSEWLLGGAARVGFAAALLLPVALALYFLRQLLEFRDPFVGWTEDASLLLTGTAWGRTWMWGAAASLLAPCAFLIARFRRKFVLCGGNRFLGFVEQFFGISAVDFINGHRAVRQN